MQTINKNNINFILESSPVGMGIRKVDQVVKYTDFTDGGSTAGTLNMKLTIPVGAFVIGTKVKVKTGFTGDTSATLAVGTSGDSNKFTNNTTVNVYSAATVGAKAENPMEFIASAATVLLTLTSGSDFGAVTAGEMLVEVFYLSTDQELTNPYVEKTTY